MSVGPEQVVFEGLPDAALVIIDGRIALANEAARALLDAAVDDLVGRKIQDLLGEDGTRRVIDHLEVHPPGSVCSCNVELIVKRHGDSVPVATGCRATKLQSDRSPLSGAVLLVLREISLNRAEELITGLAGLVKSDSSMSGMLGVIRAATPMFGSLGWWAGLLQTSESGAELVHLLAPPVKDHPIVKFARRIQGLGVLPWTWFPVVRRVYDTGESLFMTDAPNKLSRLGGFGPELSHSLREGGFNRAVWVPIRPGGVTTHLLLVVGPDLTEHDLAAMHLFAAELAAAVRLEDLKKELVRRERLAAVGEMAAVLAHEVRNPLAVIFNAVTGLKRSIDPNSDPDGLLEIIHEEADRLKRVVSDLLDFARPTAPEIRPMSMDGLIEEALIVSRSKTDGRQGETKIELPDQLPLIDSDPHLLLRLLTNVLDNAFQAVSEGGTITISGRRDDRDWLRLCVRNDGEPLQEEMRRKAFLPFFTTRATGTGLGLSVVKRTAEDLGARVALEADGQGTRLCIWLPISEGPAPTSKESD